MDCTADKTLTTANDESSNVSSFFRGKNVLVTGASGFLGKVLVWKLYESFPDIGKIYVLLRSKNGQPADKRLIQILKAKPFNWKHDYTELLNKVAAIDSDITAPGLGLSPSDASLLRETVNVVFHCAASVRFDASLKDNLRDNLYGTQEIVKLCNEIAHLDALCHVSTAYSNCHLSEIPEGLAPLRCDVERVVQMVESMPEEALEGVTDKLLEGRPNTYTYTKALAEHYVAKSEGKYPIAIVRPSIVISSANEPCPGWVDNVNGIAGLGCLAAIGMLRTIDWNYYAKSDMVPVDYVANSLICAARDVSVRSPEKLQVYNMTSGNINPISWGVFFEKLRNQAVETPPSKIVRPIIKSPKYRRANPIEFMLTKFFSELLFAYTVDLILTLIGYKKIMLKITRKMHHGYKILKPFTTNEWDFEVNNLLALSDSLGPDDRKTFQFDPRDLSWDEQAEKTWYGGRHFLLKEEPTEESYKLSRGRQRIVTMVHYTGMMLILGSFALMTYAGVGLLKI